MSFSLLLLLFCACKKNKKILIKTLLLDFDDRTRNKFLPDRRDKKRVKKEERDSLMREKERKEERREPHSRQDALHDKKNWYIELSSSSSS